MQTKQGSMLQSLLNVEAFLEQNAAKLATVVNTGARHKLAEAIAELEAHATEQSGSATAARGATKLQRALRHALLRDHMASIASIARTELPQSPDIASLRLPKGKPTAQKLHADAYGMAQTAAKHAELFIAAGLPTEFVAQLTAAADAMIAAGADRSNSRGRRSGATKGLKSRLSAGRKIVHVLDTFVTRALNGNPALLANWNVVKRTRRTGTRSASAITTTPILASPVPGPTPAPLPVPHPMPPTPAPIAVHASTTATAPSSAG